MNILHITPHLGGGVGKAHSAVLAESAADFRHHYLLLENPRDRRFADQIEAASGTVEVMSGFDRAIDLIADADIVQIEFWNHPRLYELLARPLPAMRSLFWVHVSGLAAPYYPVGLIEQAGRFVFTSPCSLGWEGLGGLGDEARSRLSVAGSGFGFDRVSGLKPASRRSGISYLGTVDFVKMHRGIFDMIDAVAHDDTHVSFHGAVDPAGEVASSREAMRSPQRVTFGGQVADPRPVLENSAIFFYPLRPDHYGTAENALIEAMSVGAVPVVMANPAEMAIVRDGENGVVAMNEAEAAQKLGALMGDPDLLDRLSAQAMQDAARLYVPSRTARLFERFYLDLVAMPKARAEIAGVIGAGPRDWYLSTQFADGRLPAGRRISRSGTLSKGSLDHFLAAFPDDPGLLELA